MCHCGDGAHCHHFQYDQASGIAGSTRRGRHNGAIRRCTRAVPVFVDHGQMWCFAGRIARRTAGNTGSSPNPRVVARIQRTHHSRDAASVSHAFARACNDDNARRGHPAVCSSSKSPPDFDYNRTENSSSSHQNSCSSISLAFRPTPPFPEPDRSRNPGQTPGPLSYTSVPTATKGPRHPQGRNGARNERSEGAAQRLDGERGRGRLSESRAVPGVATQGVCG